MIVNLFGDYTMDSSVSCSCFVSLCHQKAAVSSLHRLALQLLSAASMTQSSKSVLVNLGCT